MVDPRRALQLLARMVPTVVFVDVVRAAVSVLPLLLQLASTAPGRAVVLFSSTIAVTASGLAAVLAIATGSVLLYSVALVALVLARIPAGFLVLGEGLERVTVGAPVAELEVPWAGVAGLLALLAVDSYATAYRRGGSGLSGRGAADVLRSFASFLALSAPFVLLSLLLASFLSALLGLLESLSARLGSTPLGLLAESRLTYAVLAGASFLALVRLLDSVAGVVAPFLLPSRKLSLGVLLDETDVGRVFRPPLLGTLLGLATLVFYPVVHELLFGVLVRLPPGLGPWAPILAHALSLLLTSYVVLGSVGRSPLLRVGRLGPALLALSLLYAGAVRVSLDRGGGLPGSLLAPDFGGLVEALGRSYVGYAHDLLSLLESLLRLLGVAP